MLFNSFVFWIFFIIVLALYHLLLPKSQNRMLLVASYIFYGAWDVRFLSLILLSTAVDYFCGLGISKTEDSRKRKILLWVSILVNLGLLGFFKYFNFFAENLTSLFALFGWRIDSVTLRIVLPVGVSFYTFQTMSYTIDVYRKKMKAVHDFFDFALYVAFFPQLVAGPIERAERFLPQIQSARSQKLSNYSEGLILCVWGLFKKVVIADNAAVLVNAVFLPGANVSPFAVTAGVFAFTLQIYCDFSGYSNIARGLAKMLGFDLMLNFNKPYLAENPSDFWHRWHISFSTWLRDYLYIPLGGSHEGKLRTLQNLILVMLLGGLWHGASWMFVAWGLYHGLLLVGHDAVKVFARRAPAFSALTNFRLLKVLTTCCFVCVGWIFFRANSLEQAFRFIPLFFRGLFSPVWIHGLGYSSFTLAVSFFILALLGIYYFSDHTVNRAWLRRIGATPLSKSLFLVGVIFLIYLFGVNQASQFIYFQF